MKKIIILFFGLWGFSLDAVTAEILYGAGLAYHTHTHYGLSRAGLT